MFRQLLFYFEMVVSANRELESSDFSSTKTSAALSTGSQPGYSSSAAIFVLSGGVPMRRFGVVGTNVESLLNWSYFDMIPAKPCLITLDASLHFLMPRLSHLFAVGGGG